MTKHLVFSFCCLVFLIGCTQNHQKTIQEDYVVKLQISTNGRYVITNNINRHAYLWDIKNKTYKDLGAPFNIYSAYFIPNTNNYMLQNDRNNQIEIYNADNQKLIKSFAWKFPTYGQAITKDLNHYVAANRWFDIYKYDLQMQKEKRLFVSWCYAKEDHTPYSSSNPYKGKLPNGCTGRSWPVPDAVFCHPPSECRRRPDGHRVAQSTRFQWFREQRHFEAIVI